MGGYAWNSPESWMLLSFASSKCLDEDSNNNQESWARGLERLNNANTVPYGDNPFHGTIGTADALTSRRHIRKDE